MLPSKLLENKRILVAITGGIAAYKTCYLIRYLVSQGANVRVMMTAAAERFITKLTIETLCNHTVYSELFPEDSFAATHHIKLADWAEVTIVAPATANIIGKIANGIGDDFVSTTLLALHNRMVIAPAMNSNMWENPAVQQNITALQQRGFFICNPEEGFLAEGYTGIGRLARLEYLVQYLYRALHPSPKSLTGKTVLITAGCTQEFLDPVRMVTNPSTGKMGFALAWEAYARGASVILVYGPGNLVLPIDIETYPVVSAEDMFLTVKAHFPKSDIFISAAAIADYRPVKFSQRKIKKGNDTFKLEMTPNIDVLKEMSLQKTPQQKLIGFAVETTNEEENALKKLKAKQLDMIVLNNPLEKNAAFAADTNLVQLIGKDRQQKLELQFKLDVAYQIFEFILSGT